MAQMSSRSLRALGAVRERIYAEPIADARAERLALNEAAFRQANERMAGWAERQDTGDLQDFCCECSRVRCRVKVRLTMTEYESVRSDSAQFVVIVGHAGRPSSASSIMRSGTPS